MSEFDKSMSEFDKLCENMGVMKTVKRERYPREISLSEEFLEALKKEFYHHKLEEDATKPIREYPLKFIKALRFEVSHLNDRSDIELEALRKKFEQESNSNIGESNDKRVPEVKVDGKKLELPQNCAPKNMELKGERLCKCKRLVLKRNIKTEPVVEEVYGNKRDYPKQDIYVDGKYVATTTWAKTSKEAKQKYLEKHPQIDPTQISVKIQEKNNVDVDVEDDEFYTPTSRDRAFGKSMPRKSKNKPARWVTHQEVKDKKLRRKFAKGDYPA